MTKRILTGYNEAYGTRFYTDCEVISKSLKKGDTYKGEKVIEVNTFVQPCDEKEVCQFVQTKLFSEIVIIEAN